MDIRNRYFPSFRKERDKEKNGKGAELTTTRTDISTSTLFVQKSPSALDSLP